MIITKDNKMSDVVLHDYTLITILNRFGIKLGFKEKTVNDICLENGINSDFFLEIINAFHDENYFTEKKLKSFSISLIVNFLKKSHEIYLQKRIPQIKNLIERLEFSGDNKKYKSIILNFFEEYHKELVNHINHEEQDIYPYVLQLEQALQQKTVNKAFLQKINNHSIKNYREEHNGIDDKLTDLKSIIIKYLPPPVNYEVCNNILAKLFKLEDDLKNHSKLEERVMIPLAEEMESKILSNYGKN